MNRLTGSIVAFGRFLWKFLVGEDILLAGGVVLGLLGVWLLHSTTTSVWWVLPVVWVVALSASLWRVARAKSR